MTSSGVRKFNFSLGLALIILCIILFSYILHITEQNDSGIDSIKLEEYTAFWETELAWIP